MNLELNNITKSFGENRIFHHVSCQFSVGCYALIGPNGIGKSVLLEMLAGVSSQDSGVINLLGVGNSLSFEYKKRLTYVPSKPDFFPSATGMEFLNFISSTKNSDKKSSDLERLVEKFCIRSFLPARFDQMSLGTQKKLFLSTLAIGDADLILLDEPTNALDSESSKAFYERIAELSVRSIVILATHDEELLRILDPIKIRLAQSPTTDFLI